jgi:hypothetical protein
MTTSFIVFSCSVSRILSILRCQVASGVHTIACVCRCILLFSVTNTCPPIRCLSYPQSVLLPILGGEMVKTRRFEKSSKIVSAFYAYFYFFPDTTNNRTTHYRQWSYDFSPVLKSGIICQIVRRLSSLSPIQLPFVMYGSWKWCGTFRDVLGLHVHGCYYSSSHNNMNKRMFNYTCLFSIYTNCSILVWHVSGLFAYHQTILLDI